MTTEELVKLIAKWVADNVEQESIFLTPCPEYTVDAHSLLDYIAEQTGISREQISEWGCGEG